MAWVLAGIGNGIVLAFQGRAAAEMARASGDAFTTLAIIYPAASVLVALVLVPIALRGGVHWGSLRRVRPWMLTGGLFGGAIVLVQTATIPVLGMALTTAAFVLGSILTGTASDAVGFGAAGRLPASVTRILAMVALVAAIALAASRSSETAVTPVTVLLVLLAVGGGIASNVSQTVNGRFSTFAGDPYLPSLGNFVVASAFILPAWLMFGDRSGIDAMSEVPHWGFLAAPAAVVVVFVNVLLAPRLGALGLAAAIVSGQFLGSLVLDVIVPVPGREVTITTIVAVAIALLAAALLGVRRRLDSISP